MKYIRAYSATEALGLIDNGCVPLAGGTILVPEISLRANRPNSLIDISHIDQLKAFECKNNALGLGSLITVAEIAANSEIKSRLSCLALAAQQIGNPLVRRAATLGGNIAAGLAIQADSQQEPAGVFDLPTALLVCAAQVELESSDGQKVFPFDQIMQTGLPQNSLITNILISIPKNFRSAYRKFAWRESSGKTIVNVAVSGLVKGSKIEQLKIVAGGIDAKPRRLLKAEKTLEESETSEALIAEAAKLGANELNCAFGPSPKEAYRRSLVRTGVHELLKEILCL